MAHLPGHSIDSKALSTYMFSGVGIRAGIDPGLRVS